MDLPGPDPLNGDHHFLLQILGKNQNQAVQEGVWQLRVRPEAGAVNVVLDVWTLGRPARPGPAVAPAGVLQREGSQRCGQDRLSGDRRVVP